MIRAALLCLLALPAAAQQGEIVCGTRDGLAAELKSKWGEASIFTGLVGDGSAVIEIFGAANGTWTALIVRPDGSACPVAAGAPWIATGVPQGEDG